MNEKILINEVVFNKYYSINIYISIDKIYLIEQKRKSYFSSRISITNDYFLLDAKFSREI